VIVKKKILVVARRLVWPLDYAGLIRLPDWKRHCGILLKKLWMDIREFRIFH